MVFVLVSNYYSATKENATVLFLLLENIQKYNYSAINGEL